MPVVNTTSPTATPAAPTPLPHSTEPSAITRAAVALGGRGLWMSVGGDMAATQSSGGPRPRRKGSHGKGESAALIGVRNAFVKGFPRVTFYAFQWVTNSP